MEVTVDISKYLDAGVELAKKHPVGTTLVIVLVLFLIVTPMIGSNWIDFLNKIKPFFDDPVDPEPEEPAKDDPPPEETPVSPPEVEPSKENFDLAHLDEEQSRVMQNLALMAKSRTLPSDVGEWIACDQETLDKLVNTGWLTRTKDGYEVPAVVRDVVLKNEVPVKAVKQFLDFVAHKKYFQDGEGYQAVQFKLGIVNDVLEKVEDRLEKKRETGWLYTKLGAVYYGQKAYVRAEYYFNKALNISRDVCGEDDPDTASSYSNLGVVYNAQGKYAQAEEYYQKALDIRIKEARRGRPGYG